MGEWGEGGGRKELEASEFVPDKALGGKISGSVFLLLLFAPEIEVYSAVSDFSDGSGAGVGAAATVGALITFTYPLGGGVTRDSDVRRASARIRREAELVADLLLLLLPVLLISESAAGGDDDDSSSSDFVERGVEGGVGYSEYSLGAGIFKGA